MRALTGSVKSLLLFGRKSMGSAYTHNPFAFTRASTRNVSFEIPNGSQFTLSTQLIMMNYSVTFFHRRSTTVYLETYTLYSHIKICRGIKKRVFLSLDQWECYYVGSICWKENKEIRILAKWRRVHYIYHEYRKQEI